ncbi:putative pilus assembly protein FilE [Alkanindiges sp. WGS2144]|uniref:putative pilus assembly protein FilE n=1 Tax=Alkanindiges sp. WGS2144 TaxID=3366808 RepID=UPI0037511162
MPINIWKFIAISGLGLLCINPVAHAERSGFYTIIGPDGRIMVVDRNAPSDRETRTKVATKQPKTAHKTATSSKWSLFSGKTKSKIVNSPQQPTSAVNSTLPAGKTTPSATTHDSAPTSVSHSVEQRVFVQQPEMQSISKTEAAIKTNSVKAENSENPIKNKAIPASSPTVQPSIGEESPSVDSQPVKTIDGEQYVDSEYLEAHEFNLEGKKRFYNLPDGLGGTQVLQREKGVDMSFFRRFKAEQPQQQVVNLAKNYQRLSQNEVTALTGVQCFSEKQLKKAKLLRKDESLSLWPKPGFEPKFDFVVARLSEQINDIQFNSYADKISNPEFYWPLPIFLDDKGCVIEGVNAFYQQTISPTVTTRQALQGYMHIPTGTSYVLLTPLEAAVDLEHIQLTDKGQVRLTPVR